MAPCIHFKQTVARWLCQDLWTLWSLPQQEDIEPHPMDLWAQPCFSLLGLLWLPGLETGCWYVWDH